MKFLINSSHLDFTTNLLEILEGPGKTSRQKLPSALFGGFIESRAKLICLVRYERDFNAGFDKSLHRFKVLKNILVGNHHISKPFGSKPLA